MQSKHQSSQPHHTEQGTTPPSFPILFTFVATFFLSRFAMYCSGIPLGIPELLMVRIVVPDPGPGTRSLFLIHLSSFPDPPPGRWACVLLFSRTKSPPPPRVVSEGAAG